MPQSFVTDVLIVGAGPTGLMAANQLQRFGIDFMVIDGKAGPTLESRAIAVTARSLEIYQQMGLSDEVVANGTRMNSFHLYTEGKQRAVVKIGEIGKGLSDFSYLLAYEQYKNEKLLYRTLQENGKEVQWETSFEKLIGFENKIICEARQKQEIIQIEARYLIACDGARSPIRHQLNIPFEGGTYENKFYVADTLLKWDLGYDKLIVSPADRNFVGFFPLKEKNAYRVLGTLPDDQRDNEHITFQEIDATIKETIGVPLQFEKVNWFSIYKLHHRCVSTFRKGNVFLAGDAAHIHSPAGGQGMNTGLQDAYNICWKLAFVLKQWAKPAILDTYNEERLPFARWLMKFTDRGFKIMTSDSRWIIFLRKYVALRIAGLFLKAPILKRIAFRTLSQTGLSYEDYSLAMNLSSQKLKFKAGDLLPYMRTGDGQSINKLFTAPGFHLLHVAPEPFDAIHLKEISSHFPFPTSYVWLPIAPSWKAFGVKKPLLILVRPDNYILFTADLPVPWDELQFLKTYIDFQ